MGHSKTHHFMIAGLLIVSIVLSAFCLYLYVDNRKLHEQRADDNISNWASMLQMTQKIQDFVKTVDDTASFSLYQNTVLYTTSYKLKPAFYGGDFNFLMVMYDPLLQELSLKEANKHVPEDLLEEGLELYLQMNTDLNKICSFVVASAENTKEVKYMLLEDGSEISREIQTEINEFCSKYRPALNEFFLQMNSAKK